jgi:hypothetical protein
MQFKFKMLTKPIREQLSSLQQKKMVANDFSTSTNSGNLAVHKQAFYSIAKIIAALTVNNQNDDTIIEQFIKDIKVTYNL